MCENPRRREETPDVSRHEVKIRLFEVAARRETAADITEVVHSSGRPASCAEELACWSRIT